MSTKDWSCFPKQCLCETNQSVPTQQKLWELNYSEEYSEVQVGVWVVDRWAGQNSSEKHCENETHLQTKAQKSR